MKISTIADMTPQSTADVIAIVRSASDVQQVISSKLGGKTLSKRDLIIFDDSDSDIRLTLWGDKTSHSNVNFNDQHLTIAIKGTKYIHSINKQTFFIIFF